MKLHIFVATTQGLVAIQNITSIDDADISSIVSINGTSTTANISSAYHNFVKNGAGIIQQDFGACSYRINIAQRIDQGNSWQLAFYLAHAAHNQELLGNGQVNPGDQVICATGEVNTTSREIHRVEDVNLKQNLANEQIQQWRKMNVNTSFLVPKNNAQDINNQLPIDTKLIANLEQALSFLPSNALTDKPSLPYKKSVTQKLANLKQSQSLKPKSIELVKNKPQKNKLTFISLFISLLVLVVLTLSVKAIFFSQSEPSAKALTNANKIISPQQTWQVLLLTKPHDEINKQLQPAYAMIEKTISEQLIAENFEVTDKTLLMGATKITEQALIELNKNEINLAIRFNLTVNKLNDESRDTRRYELSATLVDLASKKQIETHNEYGEFSNEFINCDRQCLSQWFADNARKLAQDMGAILVVKLKNLPRRYQFELNFQHFLADELRLVHDQLKKLNGFISVYLLQDFGIEKELMHQINSRKYGYVSYLPLGELEMELHKSFALLGIEVKKAEGAEGNVNTLVFIRKNTPYYFYYVVAGVLMFLLLVLVYLTKLKGKHISELKRLASGQHAQGWLAYHDKISPLPFIRQPQWQAQKITYINNIQLSKELSDKALHYADRGDYNKVHLTIENALKLNADNTEAENLKEQSASFIKGNKQFLSGKSMVTAQPEQAIKLLMEAKNLNLNLAENVNKSLVKASFKLVLIAFNNKEYYKAYSLIDKYIHHPSSIELDNNNQKKLIEIRDNIEQYIQPIKGAVVGQGALANCYIFTSTTLEVGRNVNNPTNSFAIGYQQISRVGKQCRFLRENNKFYLEDQGSTNGSFLNNTQLIAQKKVNINKDSQLTLGGGSNVDNIAICQLELKVLSKNSSVLMMQLKSSVVQLVDIDNYKMAWTSMDTDLMSRWILLGKEVSLSINNDRIELGHDKDQVDIVAYLIYQNGFYIRPEKSIDGNTIDSSKVIMINRQVVYDKMPINESAIININGFDFSLHRLYN
ncbi:MAG: FHA domain-containing protein [Colwellia sp.]|nr:FHA domain-containing protein [Colwellia sp.]